MFVEDALNGAARSIDKSEDKQLVTANAPAPSAKPKPHPASAWERYGIVPGRHPHLTPYHT
jgi:hypothetical protein